MKINIIIFSIVALIEIIFVITGKSGLLPIDDNRRKEETPFLQFSYTVPEIQLTGRKLPISTVKHKTHRGLFTRSTGLFQTDDSIKLTHFAGGDGTRNNPYLITTPQHLYNVRYYCNDDGNKYYFRQEADIDLKAACLTGGSYYNAGRGWEPIGTIDSPFRSHYDGQNYTISNLTIYSNSCYQGLFGYIYGSTIANLNLTFVQISSTAHGIGSLVGCAVSSSISNCNSEGSVSGDNFTGGLVGWMKNTNAIQYTSMYNCSASGEINSTGYACGGLVGRSDYLFMDRCFFIGKVSSSGNVFTLISGVGGLVGFYSSGGISECFSIANVSNTMKGPAGGFIGNAKSVTIGRSYSNGSVSGLQCIGGFVGFITGGSRIYNCYSQSEVYIGDNGKYYGSFCGYSLLDTDIRYCYSAGKLYSKGSACKKFIGYNSGGVFTGNFVNSDAPGQIVCDETVTFVNRGDMMRESTYTNAGWDFENETRNGHQNIWGITPGKNGGFPFLLSLPSQISDIGIESN